MSCKKCGGTNVQYRGWIDANTNEVMDGDVFEDEDTWCENCEDHLGIEFNV